MESSAFWRERKDGSFEDALVTLDVRSCTNDTDWPVELAGVNKDGEDIGLSLNLVDSLRIYFVLHKQFGSMFS